LKPAFEPLGTVLPQIAQQTGLKPDCRVLSGVHDSNACFALYLRGHPEAFSLVSTGTWVVMMSPRLDPAKLRTDRDMLAMVNVLGDPLPTAHFMGGREFEVLTGHLPTKDFAEQDLRRVIDQESFLLPAFAPGGPFMGAEGKRHGPDPSEPGEVLAAATLYLALVTATGLKLLESDGDLIIDGGFVNNLIYCRLLATLCGHKRCFLNRQTDGTAIGAGMLAVWRDEKPWPLSLVPVEKLDLPGLEAYARTWRRMVGQGRPETSPRKTDRPSLPG
jgi:sugar (pentulose or hexulose) kinase